MKAAVVRDFNEGPKFENDYVNPSAQKGETVINVTAASLSNRARSDANGTHYAAEGVLPMVPGVDGVGTLPNGQKVYFVGNGGFAEQVAVENGHWVKLTDEMDDAKIAGLMNPALSSWMALKYRAKFKKGQKVMIIGATGNAGAVAVQVAKRFGASEIIAVARDAEALQKLTQLGATQLVTLSDDQEATKAALAKAGETVDVILDYLWGDVSAQAMWAIIPNRKSDSQVLKWVEIGSSAGQTAPIPGAAFRAVKLQLIGSGQGSVGKFNILRSFMGIIKSEKKNPFTFDVREVALADVETVWQEKTKDRLVFIP